MYRWIVVRPNPAWRAKAVFSILGHVDISTTMDIYVDVMSETKKKELASFDGYMASVRA